MKHLRFSILAVLTMMAGLLQAQSNVLRVDPVEGPAGKTVALPIVMENQSDIAGVQFEIAVPYKLTVDDEDKPLVSLSKTRAEGFNVVARYMGTVYNYIRPGGSGSVQTVYHKYRVILYSDDGRLILGNEGTLLTLELVTSGDLTDKTELPVPLSKATLSDRDMVNKLTSSVNGLITIKEIPRPDLTPTDVAFVQTTVDPGGQLDVNWKVKNIGTAATNGGWSEEIALVSLDGLTTKVLTTTHYAGTLAATEEVSRSVALTLPSVLGIDGIAKVQVTIIPDADADEHLSLRDNNTSKSTDNLQVCKRLTLDISPNRFEEVGAMPFYITLTRSGKWSEPQSFKVTYTDSKGQPSTETRVALPEIINILANQSAAKLSMVMKGNNVSDADSLIHFKVEPISATNTYPPVEADLIIIDDELPGISAVASKSSLKEGTDTEFQLTITVGRAPQQDLRVSLTSESMTRFSFPSSVIIPAGETSAQVTVRVVDDNVANGTIENKFTVSAANYSRGECLVILEDNDLPVLELTLTPTTVQESDGPTSVAGKLRRTSNFDTKVTIRLTDDANGGLYYGNKTLTLDKGVQEVNFNFGPVDNQDKEGDRTYTITAAVWLSSCSCSASGETAGHVSAQLTVLDNDGEALRLKAKNATVKEGESTMLTIERNNAPTSDLTVTLSCDYADMDYPHTVTFPAGQQSVSVDVTSLTNSAENDTHTVIFTVSSAGYASGTCYIMVSDQTLPDAVFKSISVSPASALVGDPVDVTVEIGNEGNSKALAANTQVVIYERNQNEALLTFVIDTPLPVGEVRSITKSITLPKNVGTHELYAVINREKNVAELSFNNNTSDNVSVEVTSPFMATLTTDKQTYNQSDVAVFSGQLSGRDVANAEFDLYVICNGTRQVQRITAETDGSFTYRWVMNNSFIGHCTAGVCYPKDSSKDELTAFDVYGLRRTSSSYISMEPSVGDLVEGTIELENPGVLPLTGVTVEVVEKPEAYDVQLTIPATIAGGQKPVISYEIVANAPADGNDWQQVKLLVSSAEGAQLPITIYTYSRMPEANLVCLSQRINTTMTKGQTREYPVMLVNTGRGNTGEVELALPEWIKCAQGKKLAGINPGDTATIVLLLSPTEEMQLNVPVTGTMGFNVQYGKGTYATYNITPVSDLTGTLKVVVADEYTYYTAEKPHVKDAEVVLRNAVTNAIVTIGGQPAQGKSDDSGVVLFENLPEGYYKLSVTADKHDSYTNNILVDPGTTTVEVVNLSANAVQVSWTVEETEVEDIYEIVTTVNYETSVPVPVVDLVVPSRLPLDSLAEGESLMYYAIATNKGLITAENTEILTPDTLDNIYVFEPLAENMNLTIAPQESYIVPVKVTRIADQTAGARRRAGSGGGCVTFTSVTYEWKCGKDGKWHRISKPITYGHCPGGPGGGSVVGGGGGFGGAGGGGGGGPRGGGDKTQPTTNTPKVSKEGKSCNPCLEAVKEALANCLANFIPGSCALGMMNCAFDKARGKSANVDCGLAAAGCVPATATMAGIISCEIGLWDVSTACWEYYLSSRRRASATDMSFPNTPFNYVNNLFEASVPMYNALRGMANYYTELLGDSVFLESKISELENLLAIVSTYPDEDLTFEHLRNYKPSNVTDSVFNNFIERYNNSRRYDEDNSLDVENRIHLEKLQNSIDSISEANQMAKDKGYAGLDDWWNTAVSTADEKLIESNENASVCATISLQIKQEMVMTRQAFRGTLSVLNGNEHAAMEDMKLSLVVSDMNNVVATAHEFQINAESLKGMTGPLELDGGWTLGAGQEGTVTVLFIPTKYAALTAPQQYSFGGTLSYKDPNTGLYVTRELYPVTMTVKPSPELDLTYFMQRDLYGDDPLTKDVVEPVEPGEFALVINNKGYGDATNVRMTTNQPEVVDNEKGLFVGFEIVSSQVNGGPATLSFSQSIANNLGTIPAHSQAYAQWWLESTMLGHFIDYDVQATHLTSYGNEDLSLLDQVTIHELIHGFTPPATAGQTAPARAFLCNDIEDADDQPDQVYFTDATQADVYMAASNNVVKLSRYEYEVTIQPVKEGWTYAKLLDPTVGKQKLLKVVRKSDNFELPLDNVWQTSRSIRDGQDWHYENRLHFVSEMAETGETFLLTYEQRPNVELDFVFSPIEYDPEFAEQTLVTTDVNKLTVTFNKSIQAETFTAEDIVYQVQGEKRDLSQVENLITPKAGKTNAYEIDLTTVNTQLPNGYYVLTVQGNGITDNEGYNGLFGRKTDWVLFRGGLVVLHTSTFPENSGTVVYETVDAPSGMRRAGGGDVESTEYGTTFILKATANEGYEFVNWTVGGVVVSSDPEYTTVANSDLDIVANFKKKQFMLDVTAEGNGSLSGAGTGYYDYDTDLKIVATPDADFKLKEWIVDGETRAADGNTLELNFKQATTVKAVFVRDIYTQTLTLAYHWNWMSTFLLEQQSLAEMSRYADRIVGQEDELFRDPNVGMVGGLDAIEPGKAYKVYATSRFSQNLRGHLNEGAISLSKGWNWVAYPYFEQKSVASITNAEDGDYIASQAGFTSFDGNTWEGTLADLAPGQGYLYKSATAKSLEFNFDQTLSPARRVIVHAPVNAADASSFIDIHRYPNTMNVTARIYRDGMEQAGQAYNVYAMAGKDVRGVSQFVGQNHYLTVYGDEPVAITFVVEQAETGETFVANETLTFVSDVVGSRKEPFAISLDSTTGIDQVATESRPMTIYNLAGQLVSRDATIKTLQRLPKGIYIVNGQKCYVK